MDNLEFSPVCPVPLQQYPQVLLSHGGGGRLMQQLIEGMFLPAFSNPFLREKHDGAVLEMGDQKLAFTTDSYVVKPLFFPGGDIGSLAVNGTVNDLAMCGAKPLYLSTGFIIEEGLDMQLLAKIIASMQQAAEAAGVQLVTGDTKVVDRGKGDGIFINTAGIGMISPNVNISPRNVRPGDMVIINGDIARHGIAIMACREGLAFESEIESDCASISFLVMELLEKGIELHCLRDPTRGGVAAVLNEIAEAAGVKINIYEEKILVREDVQGACEILGFDPLYVANEGKFIAFVKGDDAEKALEIMRSHPSGREAAIIGEVEKADSPLVTMKNRIGTTRIIDMLSGEQLPRIC